MPMEGFESWIARHRRRLSLGLFLATLTDALAVFLLVFGTAILVVKLARPDWWPHILWVVCGALPIAFWAWRRSVRNAFSRSEAVALLDSRLGAGGLLMTVSETHDGQWVERLSSLEKDWRSSLPRLRPVRTARRLWLPIIFAAGCCFVPLREARTETVRVNVVGTQVADSLTETLKVLKENEVLERKEAEELKDAIQKLADETKDAPLTHESWEVVDALRDKMRVRTEDSLMSVSKAHDALESLSADASKPDGAMTAERREQLENEVQETLRKISKSGKFGTASPELQKKLQQLMKDGKLGIPKDAAAREKMLSDLKQYLDAEAKKLGKCRGKCKGENEGEGEDYNNDDSESKDGKPGRGGANRGRGDAKLTWGDESEENGTKFKEVVLPPGTPDRPNKEVISQSASTPEVKPATSASRGALRAAGPETGRETWNRTLRPRHRAVVRNYFDTPAK